MSARADVQNFINDERPEWFDAVNALGEYSTIAFTDLPPGTVVGDNYHDDFGVTFFGAVTEFSPPAFPIDSIGAVSSPYMVLYFDHLQNWIAVDHPDFAQFQLYSDNVLIHNSPVSGAVPGSFNGLISDIGFDAVILIDPSDDTVAIDNMYFGAIPAPGAIGIVSGFFVLRPTGRRRKQPNNTNC